MRKYINRDMMAIPNNKADQHFLGDYGVVHVDDTPIGVITRTAHRMGAVYNIFGWYMFSEIGLPYDIVGVAENPTVKLAERDGKDYGIDVVLEIGYKNGGTRSVGYLHSRISPCRVSVQWFSSLRNPLNLYWTYKWTEKEWSEEENRYICESNHVTRHLGVCIKTYPKKLESHRCTYAEFMGKAKEYTPLTRFPSGLYEGKEDFEVSYFDTNNCLLYIYDRLHNTAFKLYYKREEVEFGVISPDEYFSRKSKEYQLRKNAKLMGLDELKKQIEIRHKNYLEKIAEDIAEEAIVFGWGQEYKETRVYESISSMDLDRRSSIDHTAYYVGREDVKISFLEPVSLRDSDGCRDHSLYKERVAEFQALLDKALEERREEYSRRYSSERASEGDDSESTDDPDGDDNAPRRIRRGRSGARRERLAQQEAAEAEAAEEE